MTRRPVRGLAPQPTPTSAHRPPGPATILGPDGRTWTRDEDGLYYDERRYEVFSQSALRDLIERAGERLRRATAGARPDPVMVAIANARTDDDLRKIWPSARLNFHRAAVLGRRAVLELPPREDA